MVTTKDPSSYVTRIRGLKETPQDIALRALRMITKSNRSAIQLENVPSDLLFGENVDLQSWTMILKDKDLKELSDQEKSGKKFYLDGSAKTLPGVFAYFSIPQIFSTGLLTLNVSNAKEITDYGIAMIARKNPNLSTLIIAGCIKVTDIGLREVAMHCPKLQSLNISACPGIDGVGIAAIAECCPYLAKLNISKNSIKNWSLQKIFRKCIRLEELIISYMRDISDEELRVVAEHCHDLLTLEAIDCFYLSDQCVLTLSQYCKDLDYLDLSRSEMNYRVTDVALMALGQRCHSLRTLKLNQCDHLSDVGLHWLSEGCKLLQTLELSGCVKLTDAGMRILGKECHALTSIDISDAKSISDVGIANLAKGCKNLTTLRCHGAFLLSDPRFFADEMHNKVPISAKDQRDDDEDDGMDILHLSTMLSSKSTSALPMESSTIHPPAAGTQTTLGNHPLGDSPARALFGNTQSTKNLLAPITKLSADAGPGGTGIALAPGSAASIGSASMESEGFPFNTSEFDRSSVVTPKSSQFSKRNIPRKMEIWEESIGIVALVQSCPLLSSLDLSGCFRLNRVLGKAVSKLSHLRVLNLKGCNQVHPSSFIHLFQQKHLMELEELNLTDCGKGVSNDVLITLSQNCLKLKILILVRCTEITGKGMKAIANIKLLEKLDISGCRLLTDSRLVYIVSSDKLRNLQYLDCKDIPKLSDSFVAWMSMKDHRLLSFALKGTAVTQKALYSVKDSFPYCELLTNENFYGFWPKFRVFDRLLINAYATMIRGFVVLQNRARKLMAIRRVQNILTERKILRAHMLLQRVIRGFVARKKYNRLKAFYVRINLCALKVIALFRVIVARKRIERIKRNRLARLKHEKAIILQCSYRIHLAKKELARRRLIKLNYKKLRTAKCIIIQSVIRMYLGKCLYYKTKELKRKQEIFLNYKAGFIQRLFRGFIARIKTRRIREVIQEMQRKRLIAAKIIQKAYRAYHLRRDIALRIAYRHLQHNSAASIQSLIRGYLTRIRYSEMVYEKIMKKKTAAAVKIQCIYRVYIAKKIFFEKVRRIHQERKLRNDAANCIISAARIKIARLRLKRKREEYYNRLRTKAKETILAAIKIQSIMRRFLCQKAYNKKLLEVKNKWKELFDEKKKKRFFYNKLTGEIRWKIPQDLLDLIPNPKCDNCAHIDAMIECKQCSELFCADCFRTIHGNGRRKEHEYRALFDYYGKRIDYGDGEEGQEDILDDDDDDEEDDRRHHGHDHPHMTTQNGKTYYISSDSEDEGNNNNNTKNKRKSGGGGGLVSAKKSKKKKSQPKTIFPCQWPSEIIQDEIQGWMLRVAPVRKPLKTYSNSGWEEYAFDDTDYENLQRSINNIKTSDEQRKMQKLILKSTPRVFYFNRRTFETTYEIPKEVQDELDRIAAKFKPKTQQSDGLENIAAGGGDGQQEGFAETYSPDLYSSTFYGTQGGGAGAGGYNPYGTTGAGAATAGYYNANANANANTGYMYQTAGGTYRPAMSSMNSAARAQTAQEFDPNLMQTRGGTYSRNGGKAHNYYYYPSYYYSNGHPIPNATGQFSSTQQSFNQTGGGAGGSMQQTQPPPFPESPYRNHYQPPVQETPLSAFSNSFSYDSSMPPTAKSRSSNDSSFYLNDPQQQQQQQQHQQQSGWGDNYYNNYYNYPSTSAEGTPYQQPSGAQSWYGSPTPGTAEASSYNYNDYQMVAAAPIDYQAYGYYDEKGEWQWYSQEHYDQYYAAYYASAPGTAYEQQQQQQQQTASAGASRPQSSVPQQMMASQGTNKPLPSQPMLTNPHQSTGHHSQPPQHPPHSKHHHGEDDSEEDSEDESEEESDEDDDDDESEYSEAS